MIMKKPFDGAATTTSALPRPRALRLSLAVAGGVVAALGLIPGAPAAAARPEYPHGIGVCMSQVAIEPGLAGVDHLGQLVAGAAGPGSPGSDVPVALSDFRGDGPGGCGAPPGPGHLG
jgi:hypothetical protein